MLRMHFKQRPNIKESPPAPMHTHPPIVPKVCKAGMLHKTRAPINKAIVPITQATTLKIKEQRVCSSSARLQKGNAHLIELTAMIKSLLIKESNYIIKIYIKIVKKSTSIAIFH